MKKNSKTKNESNFIDKDLEIKDKQNDDKSFKNQDKKEGLKEGKKGREKNFKQHNKKYGDCNIFQAVLKSYLVNQGRMYDILCRVRISGKIGKIDDFDTFFVNLDNLITYFDYAFAPLHYKEECIAIILENGIPKFLLRKDNSYNYLYNAKALIINNFYQNILSIYKDIPTKKWKSLNITNNMDLKNYNDIDTIFIAMQKLVWSNMNSIGLTYLFRISEYYYKRMRPDIEENKIFMNSIYKSEYEKFIDNYIKKDVYTLVGADKKWNTI